MNAPAPTLLRIGDVASRLSLSKRQIYAMVADGRFPVPVKLGPRCSRWRAADIDAWEAGLSGDGEPE